MNADSLRAFAARLSRATQENEMDLIEEGARLLTGEASRRWGVTRRLIRMGAQNEAAIDLFRTVLAGHGFQFGERPRQQNQNRPGGVAHVWLPHDACARVYEAATPALALIRAAASETARLIDAARLEHCPRCNGAGWYVTARSAKHLCQHTAEIF